MNMHENQDESEGGHCAAGILDRWRASAGTWPDTVARLARPLPVVLLLAVLSASGSWAQETAPVFTMIQREPEAVNLEWTHAGADRSYTLQVRERLVGGVWVMAPFDQPWPIEATSARVPIEPGGPMRFHRVLAVPRSQRGKLISATPAGNFTTALLVFVFQQAGIPVTPELGVSTVKIVYETIDPWGARTLASGLFAYPQGAADPLPLVSYQHGTVVETNDVPTVDIAQKIPGLGFASSGYAVALPDLLGLGDSPGFHPYHHARSEATAAVDLLRAVRTWSATNGIALSGELFLCGYSQGGHATMALHRELEAYHTNEFSVTASAPMAGAHDLSGITLDDFLSGRPLPNPYYVLYMLRAYQEVYGLVESWSDWLAWPYDVTLPPLIDSRVSGGTINEAMTNDVRHLLSPALLAAVQTDPDHPLRVALRDNDLYRWLPRAPMLMAHCQGDLDVPYENSVKARDAFAALGAIEVSWVDPQPAAGHGECAIPAFLAVKEWFDTLRGEP